MQMHSLEQAKCGAEDRLARGQRDSHAIDATRSALVQLQADNEGLRSECRSLQGQVLQQGSRAQDAENALQRDQVWRWAVLVHDVLCRAWHCQWRVRFSVIQVVNRFQDRTSKKNEKTTRPEYSACQCSTFSSMDPKFCRIIDSTDLNAVRCVHSVLIHHSLETLERLSRC
jgi:hypothetical protein